MYAQHGEAEGFAKIRRNFLFTQAGNMGQNNQDVLPLLRQLREESPDDLEIGQQLGGFLIAKGEVSEGLKFYKELVEQRPEIAVIQVIIGLSEAIDQTLDRLLSDKRYVDALTLLAE